MFLHLIIASISLLWYIYHLLGLSRLSWSIARLRAGQCCTRTVYYFMEIIWIKWLSAEAKLATATIDSFTLLYHLFILKFIISPETSKHRIILFCWSLDLQEYVSQFICYPNTSRTFVKKKKGTLLCFH
jgi:hypothetical protein